MTHWPGTLDIAISRAVTPPCAAGCLMVVALVMVGMTAMTAKMIAVRNPGIAIFRFIVNSILRIARTVIRHGYYASR